VSTVGAMIGMGPVTYQGPGISKCDEKIIDACNTPTRCCAVVACTYCLEWREYGEDPQYGTATTDDSGNLSGEIAGFLFEAIWQRNEYTNDCELGLWIDGETVGVLPLCGVLDGCNDVSSELTYQVRDSYGNATREGTLSWQKKTLKPLPYRKDENGCTQKFCGNCDCTCKALCVDVREVVYSDFIDTYRGVLPDTSGNCEAPVWAGTIGKFTISLALSRDEYDNCVVIATANGEQATVIVDACDSLSGTVELYDGSSFTFRCNDCLNCEDEIGDCICGRPLGQTLTLLWSSGNGTHGDAPREFTLSYGFTSAEGIVCDPYPVGGPFPAYTGSASGTFPIPQGGTRGDTLYVMMVCCLGCPNCVYYRYASAMAVGDLQWYITYMTLDCNCPAIFTTDNMQGPLDYQINDVTITEEESNCQ
jgi:hypothetical protein